MMDQRSYDRWQETVKLDLYKKYGEEDYRPLGDRFQSLRQRYGEDVTYRIITGKVSFNGAFIPFNDRFFTEIVPRMLLDVMTTGDLEQDQIEEAFRYLELYCLNLIHYYWKPEISRLKRYTGIYRTKLLDVLPDVDNFIEELGYTLSKDEEEPELYLLTKYIPRDLIRRMALDCFIAQEHCKFLGRVTEEVKKRSEGRLNWKHVAHSIDQLEGDLGSYVFQVMDLDTSGTQSLFKVENENTRDIGDDELY